MRSTTSARYVRHLAARGAHDVVEVLSTAVRHPLAATTSIILSSLAARRAQKDQRTRCLQGSTGAPASARRSREKAKKSSFRSAPGGDQSSFLTADATGPKHLQIKLSRAKFESLIETARGAHAGPCKRALEAMPARRSPTSTRCCSSVDRVACRWSSGALEELFGKGAEQEASTPTRSWVWRAVQAGCDVG